MSQKNNFNSKSIAGFFAKNLPATTAVTAGTFLLPGPNIIPIVGAMCFDAYRAAKKTEDGAPKKDNPYAPRKR